MALADALLPIIDPDREEAIRLAKGVLEGYGPAFKRVYAERCAAKLGLEASDESDTLFQSLLEVMQNINWTSPIRLLNSNQSGSTV